MNKQLLYLNLFLHLDIMYEILSFSIKILLELHIYIKLNIFLLIQYV